MSSSASPTFARLCLILALTGPAGAVQPRPVAPHPNPPPPIRLFHNAGLIFVGTVLAVQRIAPADSSGVATMQVIFRVKQGILGVHTGQTLVIHEWAGLWQAGERYRRSDELLLFLYSPSKLGLTSPIGGPLGRFPLDSDGKVLVKPFMISSLSRDPQVQRQLGGMARLKAAEFAGILLRAGESMK